MGGAFNLPSDFEDCIGIFQGGGCRAAAYAGAFAAATERGVNFDEVAGASAGAIAVVLVAAGATTSQLDSILRQLDFKQLLVPPKGRWFPTNAGNIGTVIYNLVRFNGMHDGKPIEEWVEKQLRLLLPELDHPKVKFSDLRKPAAVIAADLESHGPIVWSTRETPDYSVAEAVRSSCTIPFFFQPHGPYVDGGVLSNLPLHIVKNDSSDQRRTLAFTLVDAEASSRPSNLFNTASALFSTVTEGGKSVQQSMHSDVDVIRIHCGEIKATDFDKMNDGVVSQLVAAGRKATEDFLDGGSSYIRPLKPSAESTHLAQTLTIATDNILHAQRQIVVRLSLGRQGHKWVFDLFSALLMARLAGVSIGAVIELTADAKDSEQQVETLRALGCTVTIAENGFGSSPEVIICDPNEHGSTMIVLSPPTGYEIHARMLSGIDGDADLIRLVARDARVQLSQDESHISAPSLQPAPFAVVEEALLKVRAYSDGATVKFEDINLAEVDSWARYAHVYKQRQQAAMLRELRQSDIDPFDPYWVDYGDGTRSLAMPIVVERQPNGRCTVVNGLSRLLLLLREGAVSARCAVVDGVVAPPPAVGTEPLSYLGVRVGVRQDAHHRYPGFTYQHVRSVERHAHALRTVTEDGGL